MKNAQKDAQIWRKNIVKALSIECASVRYVIQYNGSIHDVVRNRACRETPLIMRLEPKALVVSSVFWEVTT